MTHDDDLLGAALRELETPEHRPHFHRELRGRLQHEQRPRRTRTLALRAGALVAAAAAAAVVLTTVRHGGSPAEAAIVQERMRDALASLRNLSGGLVASGTGQGKTVRFRFVLDTRGDLRIEGPRPGDVEVLDAAALRVRSAQHSASLGGSTLFYAVRSGVPLGPPDDTSLEPGQSTLGAFGAAVQAALAAGNPSVEDVTYEGRPAWRLLLATEQARVTVDRATGMAVRVDDLAHHRTLRIVGLAVNRRLPAGTFTLAFPEGAEVMRFDSGFRKASASQAPLAPTWLPAGYELLRAARHGSVWSLLYRHGFGQLVVTVRRGSVDWSPYAGLPHAQAHRKGYLVTAAGAATPADLERVVRSAR
ncbi:MAG TPA: hypothetical protein VHC67_05365 [Gaiellaceae bacterium]|nr:hypothetical protein [Gaiellaceae bacterium]